MSVTVEKNGAVTTVILHRPEVRNAVDRETAEALVAAFNDFAADDASSVAVLYGEGGTFCAGADLKAIAAGRGNRTEARSARRLSSIVNARAPTVRSFRSSFPGPARSLLHSFRAPENQES